MKLWHDRSHLSAMDGEYISRGYAEDDIFSVRLTFEYSEAQQHENSRNAERMTTEQWTAHYEEAMQRRSAYIFPVMEAVANKFVCYQYDKDNEPKYDSPDWELFFWCDNFANTSNGGLSGRDYSYIRLSFNALHDAARHMEICNRLILFLTERFSELDNLSVAVQHKTQFFDDKIRQDAAKIAGGYSNTKGVYRGMEGRFIMTKDGLMFLKKWKRRWGYLVDAREVLAMAWKREAA